MLNCLAENKMLIKQRDELWPLLMNGQVSVNYHLYYKLDIQYYIQNTHSVANFTKSIVCLIGFSKKHASNCLIFTTFVVARLAHRGWAGKHI